MSELSITSEVAEAALNKLREHKGGHKGELDMALQYREAHRKRGCRFVTYTPDQEDLMPLIGDARCELCVAYDKQISAE